MHCFQGSPFFENNVDVISCLADFVDDNQYLFFASVCKNWRSAWQQQRPKITKAVTRHASMSQLIFAFVHGLSLSSRVCAQAAGLGKLDLLECARACVPLGQYYVFVGRRGRTPPGSSVAACQRVRLG